MILALILSQNSFSWDQPDTKPISECSQFIPYGELRVSKPNSTLLCRTGYLTLHDNLGKIPVYGVYTIFPKNTIGCFPRTNAFKPDGDIPASNRSTSLDYVGSGYDQGHNVPDGDESYGTIVELESFLMTNMTPQLPNFNRGVWKKLETSIRSWSYNTNHPLQVISGPIYDYTNKTIGKGKVIVPSAFYKVIVDTVTGENLAFILPHTKGLTDFTQYQVTVSDVESKTGIAIPLQNKNTKYKIWNININNLSTAKKINCKG